MTTTVDELMADDWNRLHPYDAEVTCECGEAWTIRCVDGEPINPDAALCAVCGKWGEIQ